MTEVALHETRNRLSELIDRVQRGAVFVITRRGTIVAQLAPPATQDDAGPARNAAAGLRAARAGVRLRGLKPSDLTTGGRR